MLVLALNCGSSSLKFALYEAHDRDFALLAEGIVERITERPLLRARFADAASQESSLDSAGYPSAIDSILDWLTRSDLLRGRTLDLVGHRVVHGGARHRDASILDAAVLAAIEQAGGFARLHNAPALAAIRAVTARMGPDARQVAVFDTGFHREMPARARRYAIPLELAERHGFERFGFHGIAHRYMAEAAAAASGAELASLRLVTVQLGSGCSAAAIDGGRSIDTTMGLTPLEGLMMATRSGDVDPALPALLASAEGVSADHVQALLNERSGLLGVSGRSSDMRDLLVAERAGDERSALAIEMFCYRVRKQIGAYLAALGGAQVLVFGGGIGEHEPEIRRRICEPLEWLGVHLDTERNAFVAAPVHRVSRDGSPIEVYVVRVDEQRGIAMAALACAAEPEEARGGN